MWHGIRHIGADTETLSIPLWPATNNPRRTVLVGSQFIHRRQPVADPDDHVERLVREDDLVPGGLVIVAR